METSSCPLCGDDRAHFFRRAACPRRGITEEYTYVRCSGCTLVRLDPFPTAGSLDACYDTDYESEWGSQRGLKQRVENLLVKRLPRKPPGRLLDVGCGTGAYLFEMERLGWDVTGVDRYATQFSHRAIHPAVRQADLLDAGLPGESFDVVTLWWVIEHLPDPLAVLREVRRVLKPSGAVVLATCGIDSWEARVFGSFWHHLLPPEHVCHFSPATLGRALSASGFTPGRVRHVPLTASVVGSLNGWLRHKGLAKPLQSPFAAALGAPLEAFAAAARRSGLFVISGTPS